MSLNSIEFLKELEIINEGVEFFVGKKFYMATGNLSNEETNDLELVTYDKRPSRAALTAKPGDVIFARMKGTNKVLLITEKESDYIFSTGFVILRSSEKINKFYLAHYLKSKMFQDEKDKLSTGATQKAINNQSIQKLKLPFLPLAIQNKISEILNSASEVNRKDKLLLKKYDELAESTFIDLFGHPFKNEMKFKKVKIADIVLKEKNKIRSGPFGSDLLHSEFVQSGISVLGIDNVVENKFINHGQRFITEQKFNQLSRYKVFEDDVLVTIMGTVGRSAVVPKGIGLAINTKHLVSITTDKSIINPHFLSYSLTHNQEILFQIKSKSKGAIMDGLNIGIIKELEIFLPPLELQNRFIEFLNNIVFQKELLLQKKSEILLNSLIQKAFSGQLIS